jgi:formamidopyrimidine-DNA glycosylase
MPELPEVETVVQTLRPILKGRRIVNILLNRTDIITPAGFDLVNALNNRKITDISRRGKRIIFHLDDGNRFYIHLGMSGRLMVVKKDSPMAKHTHLLIDFEGSQLRFVDPRRFGGIFWLGAQLSTGEGMGPEPLTVRPAQLAKLLSQSSRAIKNVLLDQTILAGLGNIYADEALFTSRIHPLTPAKSLSKQQIEKLNRAIKLVLRRAIEHRGSTLRDYRDPNDEAGKFQKLHQVYHRNGNPCPVCKTIIEKIVLGGRSTHFCPKCQKKPVLRK